MGHMEFVGVAGGESCSLEGSGAVEGWELMDRHVREDYWGLPQEVDMKPFRTELYS